MLLLAACLAALAAPIVLGPDGPLRLGPTVAAGQPRGPRRSARRIALARGRSPALRGRVDGSRTAPSSRHRRRPSLGATARRRSAPRLGRGGPARSCVRRTRLAAPLPLRPFRPTERRALAATESVVQIRYDRDGHVREIAGPGIQRWRFQRKSAGLRATDTLGHAWIVTTSGARTRRERSAGARGAHGVRLARTDRGRDRSRRRRGRASLVGRPDRGAPHARGPELQGRARLPIAVRARSSCRAARAGAGPTTTAVGSCRSRIRAGRRATWKRDEKGNVVGYELGPARAPLRSRRYRASRLDHRCAR